MDLSDAYENGAYIPGAAAYPPRWAAAAAAFRDRLGDRAETGLAYGDGHRQRFDLFRPRGPAEGLVVFVHGGYWRRFHRTDWSHLAAGPLARGWAVAMPSYTLAPETRIGAITAEIAAAVGAAAKRVDGPVVVTGHSAGGHLAARMRCRDVALGGAVEGRLRRVVPIRTRINPQGNTAIAVVATDAALSKAQAKRMAVAAHDGIARALVPSHTPFDGDLVFAAATGARPVDDPVLDPLLIGHAAAMCLSRAIARAVWLASPAPGDPFPCWQERFGNLA